jgi:ABC-type uncharacterized transport system permease subunit
MDTESRLRRIETDVRHTRTLTWIVLVFVVVLGLWLLRIIDSDECLISIVMLLALSAVAHLLVSFGSGLWRFWTSRGVDAELQERIVRAYIAERAKTRDKGPTL